MKALFLPSHVGLGHVARDEAIARSLRGLLPGIRIDWCSAEPASTHLNLWREKILPCSEKLMSFSIAIENIYNKHGYSLRELRKYLSIIRSNYEVLERNVKLNDYDLVFADEFWELMLSAPQDLKDLIVFGSDLVFMPYRDGLVPRLLSLILNNYFKHSFTKFRNRIYMNTLPEAPKGRWYYLFGENVRKWISENMVIGGLCTSYLSEELPQVRHARRALGVDDEYLIVSSVGGTSARSEIMLHNVLEAVKKLRESDRLKARLAVVSGPRTELLLKGGVPDWLIPYKTLKNLSTLYMAGDLFIVRPGRTTVADLECLPKNFKALLVPIRTHLEQEHISEMAASRFPNLFKVIPEGLGPQDLAGVVRSELKVLNQGSRSLPEDCGGSVRVSKYLMNLLEDDR